MPHLNRSPSTQYVDERAFLGRERWYGKEDNERLTNVIYHLHHIARHLFKKDFKTNGTIPLSTYLTTFKVGDIVDIKMNSAQQKGAPHKYYSVRWQDRQEIKRWMV